MKGHGYSNDLLEACICDAKAQGKERYLHSVRGRAESGNSSLTRNSLLIRASVWQTYPTVGSILCIFPLNRVHNRRISRNVQKHPVIEEAGFVLYYTDQCPYTYYWVPRVQEAAKEHGIPFKVIHITDKESAQNVPAPVTTYALFRDGQFLTQSIQSDKKFLALAGLQN